MRINFNDRGDVFDLCQYGDEGVDITSSKKQIELTQQIKAYKKILEPLKNKQVELGNNLRPPGHGFNDEQKAFLEAESFVHFCSLSSILLALFTLKEAARQQKSCLVQCPELHHYDWQARWHFCQSILQYCDILLLKLELSNTEGVTNGIN
jgi:hypothetical protein